MVKIFRITTEINISSIGRTTEQIGNKIITEGWESYIAYGRTGGCSSSYTLKIGNIFSVYTHGLLTRFFDLQGRGSYIATKKLIKKIRIISPNIIHLHNIHGYYINYPLLFSFLAEYNRPVVWTQHDCWSYTGHCAHYTFINCVKWKSNCYNCPLRKYYPRSVLFDNSRRNYLSKRKWFTLPNNITIVAVSDWIKGQLEESFLSKYPIVRIYNGVDTTVFKPMLDDGIIRAKYRLGSGILLLAVATSWSNAKGLNDYLQLRKRLTKEFTIVLLGVTNQIMNNLPQGIIGIKRTDNIKELVEIYSVASIVMNLSKAESFGKTTVEGLACGVPSIVYNTTASPELVDEMTGRVVKVGDIDGVVRAVDDILKIDKKEISDACRARALNLFDMDHNYELYISLYKSLLK